MVTARYLDTIAYEFAGMKKIEINASVEDLQMYAEGRISCEDRLLEHVQTDPALGKEIVKTVVENAQQMSVTSFDPHCLAVIFLIADSDEDIRFLFAQLHMDSIATNGTLKAIREALRMLPRELDDTYDEAMRRIESQNDYDRQLAERVLSWISFAARPITLEELQCALAVEKCQPKLCAENLINKKLLTSVCAGLVTIDEKGIIGFVHYTTKEYFERIRVDRFPDAQREISETCLTYLLFGEFANGPCLSGKEMSDRIRKYPLLDYAAQHWGDHARGEAELALRDLIVNFLEQEANVSSFIQAMDVSKCLYRVDSQLFPRNVSGLAVAALFGMKETVQLLLSNDADVEAEDSDRRTALHWAAERGHELVAQMLLDNGAEIERRDHIEWTPLLLASEYGHLKRSPDFSAMEC